MHRLGEADFNAMHFPFNMHRLGEADFNAMHFPLIQKRMEKLEIRFELTTPSLRVKCSTG